MKIKTKNLILGLTADIVRDLLYYQRKECEQLSVGVIEDSIKEGIVSEEEIVEAFRNELSKQVKK